MSGTYTKPCVFIPPSAKEKRQDAERASIKYKQVEYMSSRVGQVFDGVISSVTDWGIYVEEKEAQGAKEWSNSATSAMIFYVFDEKNYRIVGERTKKSFTLGDPVRFKVAGTDMVRKNYWLCVCIIDTNLQMCTNLQMFANN